MNVNRHQRRSRIGGLEILVDLALAAGLALALLVVFGLDHLAPATVAEAPRQELKPVEQPAPEPEPAPVKKLRLGVTPPFEPRFCWDDMGRLLVSLGDGYGFRAFPLEDLRDSEKISEYDVIFLACSGLPLTWLKDKIGASERAGAEEYTPNDEALNDVAAKLKAFVSRGGTLYASDRHYTLVARAFPEIAQSPYPVFGKKQKVNAKVVDAGLKELIGGEMELNFDQAEWCPATFQGEQVTVYMEGKYEPEQGEPLSAPFLVRFPFHDGTVIFTSFHNEKQNSENELKLLRYLVFAAVTAEVDTKVRQTMVQGGFSPAKQNLFSASSGEQSAGSVYHADKAGDLQFVLGFQNAGARLKLTVKGPDGKLYEQVGTSTITIDVQGAAAGDWEYTITAIKLPNENFPFTVTVGQK